MRTVKMSQADRPGTLVDYVTGQMERRHPGDLRTVFAPGGEFEVLTSAARHKIPDLADELRKLRSYAEQLCGRLLNLSAAAQGSSMDAREDAAAHSEDSGVDDVLLGCQRLLASRIEELEKLEAELKQLEEKYEEIVVWFHMEERGARKPIDEFFHIWDKFLRDVQVAHKAFEQQELKEKRKTSMPPRRATMHVPREKERGDRSLRSLTPRRSGKDSTSLSGDTPTQAQEDAASSIFPTRPRFSTDFQRHDRTAQVEKAGRGLL